MNVFKVVIYAFIMVVFGLIAFIGLIGIIVSPFDTDGASLDVSIFQSLVSFVMWGGLTYLFWRLFSKALNALKHESTPGDSDPLEVKAVEKTAYKKPPKRKKEKPSVEPIYAASEYQFDYIDSAGDFSSRHVKYSRVTNKSGNTYLNGVDLDKHASRTFRTDRILSLVDMDSGEMIVDAEAYFEAVV